MLGHIFQKVNILASDLFSALSHEVRLRCVILLLDCDELCVCDLADALGAAQPNISRHLGLLRATGAVSDRRQGQWIYYRINPDLPDWVLNLLHVTADAVGSTAPFVDDRCALVSLSDAPTGRRCGG